MRTSLLSPLEYRCDNLAPLALVRILATLTRLQAILDTLTLTDPTDQKSFDQLEEVRAKMRMIDIWLHKVQSSDETTSDAPRRVPPSDLSF